jgi:hypothetical protein
MKVFVCALAFVVLFVGIASAMPVVDVVIVGAGITGITAARTAVDNGLTVAILEADDHYGGRIHTVYGPSGFPYPVEMGAGWVHDQFVNPMYPVLVNAGIPMQLFYQSDSVVFEAGQIQNQQKVNTWVNREETYWTNANPYRQTGVSDAQAEALAGYTGGDTEVDTTIQFFHEQWVGNNTEYHDSVMWDNTPSSVLGPDHIVLTGYVSVLNYFLDRSPAVRSFIQLNSAVYNVNYQGNDGTAIVSYMQGGNPMQIKANKGVVVTVSINVLKHGDISFNPPLPTAHVTSMNKLMCSAVNKVALFFDQAGAAILSDNKLQHNYVYRIGYNPNLRYNDALTCFINWQFVRGQAVLTSFYQGNYSRDLEAMSDSQVITKHMTAIRDFLPTMPDPISYSISRWGSNPYTRCSYTDFAVGATLSDLTQLSVPIGSHQNVLLAGEASNWPAQGTVYSGYMSAITAIQFLLSQ